MSKFRLLALESDNESDDEINQSTCMLEQLGKSDNTSGSSKHFGGHIFYARYDELLESTWLKSALESIHLNKEKSKFMIVKRG